MVKGHFAAPESHIDLPESHIKSPEAEFALRRRMDIFEAIYTRRTVRKFLDTPIEFDKLIEVLRAGSYAPCAGNLQNWKFLLETNREAIREMYHHTLEQDAFNSATAAIIIVADMEVAEKYYGMRGKRLYSVQNCAAAAQNILLAAHALGLGGVWIGAFDENRINDRYKIPSTSRTQAIILLGYPDEVPQPRHMKHLWYLINFHRYGLKYEKPHLITHDLSEFWEQKRSDLQSATDRAAKKAGLGGAEQIGEKSQEAVTKALDGAKERTKRFLASLKKKPAKKKR